MDLRGRWRRETDELCAARYPAEVEFADATYLAAKGPEQGFITWDAGIYRAEPEGRVLVSTATDELLPYQIEDEGERITFTDPEGCRFFYRRGCLAERLGSAELTRRGRR